MVQEQNSWSYGRIVHTVAHKRWPSPAVPACCLWHQKDPKDSKSGLHPSQVDFMINSWYAERVKLIAESGHGPRASLIYWQSPVANCHFVTDKDDTVPASRQLVRIQAYNHQKPLRLDVTQYVLLINPEQKGSKCSSWYRSSSPIESLRL